MDILRKLKMGTRLIALLTLGSILTGGCSRRPESVRYENLGTGEGKPKAAPMLVAAKAVLANIQAEDWNGLHRRMTPQASLQLPRPRLAAQCETMCKQFGVPANVEILEIHLGEFPGRPANVPPMALIGVDGHSEVLPNPVRIVSPVSGDVAIVLGRATSRDNGLKSWITIVLHRVPSGWGMLNLHMNVCEANGHDGQWYISQAEEFSSKGMQRIAFLYRNFGAQLLMPGRFIMVPSASQILKNSARTEPPPSLPFPGIRPSETWTTDAGEEFVVEFVSIVGAASLFTLEIRYESAGKDPSSAEAKARNQRLFQYVRQHFPEYQQAFDGIFIGSFTPVGKGFREFFPFDERDEDSADESGDGDGQ